MNRPLITIGLLLSLFVVAPNKSYGSSFFEAMKGCFIMGGIGVSGTAIALSESKVSSKSSTPLVSSFALSCLFGSIMVTDINDKAYARSSAELKTENQRLRDRRDSVMYDIKVMNGEWNIDGTPVKKKKHKKKDLSRIKEAPEVSREDEEADEPSMIDEVDDEEDDYEKSREFRNTFLPPIEGRSDYERMPSGN